MQSYVQPCQTYHKQVTPILTSLPFQVSAGRCTLDTCHGY
jgi:hypothetical protein